MFQPSIPSGHGLQRFVQQEFGPQLPDNDYSESIAADTKVNIDKPNSKFPNFALVEEVTKPETPLFYDVPIKIEETNPDDVRTIYVPIENAINVPESFNVNLGSIGYNKISETKVT